MAVYQAGPHLGEDVRLPERRIRGGARVRGAQRGGATDRLPENVFHNESAKAGNLLFMIR